LQFAILFLFAIGANLISRSINAFRMPFTRNPKVQSQDHAVRKISSDLHISTWPYKKCVCTTLIIFSAD